MNTGDKVLVEGTIIGFNVGGECQINFGRAYGDPNGERGIWVAYRYVHADEPWKVRLKRRIAISLHRMADKFMPTTKKSRDQ